MEKEFVEWLVQRANQSASTGNTENLKIGVGDDAALIAPISESIVIATDSIAEGTHFDLDKHSFEKVGRKLLAVNLSDLAAMAAEPLYCTLNFQVPKRFELGHLKQIYKGVEDLANQHRVTVIGGDTNSWDGPLCLGATVIGKVDRPWRLSGAQPNDAILVTGEFGGSLLGHHLEFQPRCEFALQLAKRFPVNACTDVTDSLSLDLLHMAHASKLSATVDLSAIPISAAAKSMAAANSHTTPLDHAMTDGEDFELLLAVSQSVADEILASHWDGVEITQIGTFTEGEGLFTLDAAGHRLPFSARGYCH